ncbi:MAG: septum site-determining protein MinC [Anaerolineales bacterium]|nr:septum site-determining protein MinC [Anaerolineales bacterium]
MQIKGIREGLLITLGEGTWLEARQALLDHVKQQADFLHGARIIINVGPQEIRAADLGQLRDILSDAGLTLWGVLSNSAITQQTAQSLGLATRIGPSRPEREEPTLDTSMSGEGAVLIRRTLRSGFSLQHAGHVIVIGDINPGAEVVAGGDIVVWGHLRGMVHAGAEGDEDSVVCALDLSPTQLRIANKIAVTPSRHGKPQPETARIVDGNVVAEPWKASGKK